MTLSQPARHPVGHPSAELAIIRPDEAVADRTGAHAAAPPRQRNPTLDAVKAVAIVLVVVGHSIQTAYPQFDEVPAFRVIYAFHMPLFMFVSGLAAAYSRDLTSLNSLRRRATTLVLPFAVWYVLDYGLDTAWHTISVKDYATRLVRSPDYGLWFLWVLFLCYVVLAVTLRVERRTGPVVFAAVWLVLHFAPFNIGGFGLLKWHIAFFGAGFLAARSSVRWRLAWGIVPGLAFLPLVVPWRRVGDPAFAASLAHHLDTPLLAHGVKPVLLAYSYVVPFTAIIGVVVIVTLVVRHVPHLTAALLLVAPFTLDIYAIHFHLLRWPMQGLLGIVGMAAIALLGSLAISRLVIRRSRWLSLLLLGGRTAPARRAPAAGERAELPPHADPNRDQRADQHATEQTWGSHQ